jgi:hypothetical protein
MELFQSTPHTHPKVKIEPSNINIKHQTTYLGIAAGEGGQKRNSAGKKLHGDLVV